MLTPQALVLSSLVLLACQTQKPRPSEDPTLATATQRRSIQEMEEARRRERTKPQIQQAEPRSRSTPDEQIQALLLDGRMADALQLLEGAERTAGANATNLLRQAEVYTLMQRPQRAWDCRKRALQLAEAALKQDGMNKEALAARAKALSYLGPTEELPAAVQLASSACPQDDELRLLSSMLQDLSTFWHELDRVAPQTSATLGQLMQRAALEKDLGHPAQALQTLAHILRGQPELHLALAYSAGCHGDLGQYQQQYELSSRALRSRPDSAIAILSQAESLMHLGNPGQAEILLDGALELQPDFPRGHFLRAVALMDMNRYLESLAAFRTCIQQWPRDADYHANLAKLLVKMGDWAGALEACDQALALNPLLPNTLSDRAGPLAMLGRTDEAFASLDRALEIDPGNVHAKRMRQVLLQQR